MNEVVTIAEDVLARPDVTAEAKPTFAFTQEGLEGDEAAPRVEE